jgi:hypothetical protein
MVAGKRHAFVSYAREDEDLARALRDRVGESSIECFIDTSAIRAGDDWRAKVKVALHDSYVVIVLCTASSARSHEVTFEWAYAMGQGLAVIPVVYESNLSLPAGLHSLDRLDFIDPAHRQWDRLIARVLQIRAENPATIGTLRHLGIEKIFAGRSQLIARFTVPQILEKIVDSSELLVVGRSLEGWAREFRGVQLACENKSIRVRMAIVDPELAGQDWMIPVDYAILDLQASIEKFRKIRDLTGGSFELFVLPNAPLFSLTVYRDQAGPCGVLEIGANLSFDDRFAFVLRPPADGSTNLLNSIYSIYDSMLTMREPILAHMTNPT